MSEESKEAVELARHGAHLSSEENEPYTVSGIAIGEGDVTLGQSGIKKKWTREALKPATDSLEGRPLVVDHENSAYGVVGEVTRVEYQDGVGVLYEAELDDEELAEKIENGRLEVSIRGFHPDVEQMEEDDETGAKLIKRMKFDNLSIVPTGAAPSNTVTMGEMDQTDTVEAGDGVTVESGPSTQFTAAECAAMMFEDFEENAVDAPDWSEGQMVNWQVNPQMMGKIVHIDESKKIVMVEIMEEEDGEMKSSGFTVTAGYGDLLPADSEEAAERPEGAEKEADDTKYEEMPERYPEGTDTPREEASEADEGDSDELDEDTDGPSTESDEQTSPDDDADISEQSRGAGAGEGPEATLTNVTFEKQTMTDVEDELSEYDDARVVEGEDLDELREKASKVDELEAQFEELKEAQETTEDEPSELEELKEDFSADLEELKDRTRVLDEVNRSDVEELADHDDPMVVEETEFEELQETVDEVRSVYAEALADHIALDADTVEDKFGISEMKEQLEEFAEADDVTEELSPAPKGDDPEEEELEEAADGEELSEEDEDVEAKQAELRERILN